MISKATIIWTYTVLGVIAISFLTYIVSMVIYYMSNSQVCGELIAPVSAIVMMVGVIALFLTASMQPTIGAS